MSGQKYNVLAMRPFIDSYDISAEEVDLIIGYLYDASKQTNGGNKFDDLLRYVHGNLPTHVEAISRVASEDYSERYCRIAAVLVCMYAFLVQILDNDFCSLFLSASQDAPYIIDDWSLRQELQSFRTPGWWLHDWECTDDYLKQPSELIFRLNQQNW